MAANLHLEMEIASTKLSVLNTAGIVLFVYSVMPMQPELLVDPCLRVKFTTIKHS